MSLALITPDIQIQSEKACSHNLFSLIAEVEVLQRQMPVPWRHSCLFQDTDVIVWDVINESGLYRLKGHKDAVTQVLFLKEKNLLVTRWARWSVVVNQESSRGFTCNLDILGATAICIFLLGSWNLRPTGILDDHIRVWFFSHPHISWCLNPNMVSRTEMAILKSSVYKRV